MRCQASVMKPKGKQEDRCSRQGTQRVRWFGDEYIWLCRQHEHHRPNAALWYGGVGDG